MMRSIKVGVFLYDHLNLKNLIIGCLPNDCDLVDDNIECIYNLEFMEVSQDNFLRSLKNVLIFRNLETKQIPLESSIQIMKTS